MPYTRPLSIIHRQTDTPLHDLDRSIHMTLQRIISASGTSYSSMFIKAQTLLYDQ